MVFSRSSLGYDPTPTVRGRSVLLRAPYASDYPDWAELRARSRAALEPWEPAWPRDDLTRSAFRRRLRHYAREAREDTGYAFLILDAVDERVVGGISLSNVRRGVTQSAELGYWLGVPYFGQGRMSDAVRALLPVAFERLRLHRVEAATMPENAASIRVLERSGFVREGYARQYIMINGRWADHILFAAVDPAAATRGDGA